MIRPHRVTGLDQLRGALATIVMIFHYSCLTKPHLPSFIQLSLDKLGYYSVCSFYVLSGAALYIVYHKRSLSLKFCRDFFIKRFARIAPLFWLATTLALALQMFGDGSLPGSKNIFLVYSLLFSWVDPGLYYVGGAWSIGNEWVFYSIFPLMLLAKHWGGLRLELWLPCHFSSECISPFLCSIRAFPSLISGAYTLIRQIISSCFCLVFASHLRSAERGSITHGLYL